MVELINDPAQVPFERPGKHHYQVAFPLDSSWGYSLVPLTVINGLRPRGTVEAAPPAIAAFGGTHGNEYEGQIAIKRLCLDLDADELAGRVILVPQLSETACVAHERTSGADGVNMNRAFPGDPKGTVSYRIAHFVKTRIFPQVRVVVDMHSGGKEAVFPLCTSLHPIQNGAQFQETLDAARLFDTPFVFIYSRQMASGLLTDEAEDDAKIAIGGEFGFGEGNNVKGIRHAYEGFRNLLRHYGHLNGKPRKIDTQSSSAPRVVAAPHLADYVPAPRDGVWEPLVEPGENVQEGALIGRLHDFADHSSAPHEVHAHRAGVVIALYFAAVCFKGRTLFVIAQDWHKSEP